jgi:hypothetical protein
MATATPSALTVNVQTESAGQESWRPVKMVSAGIGATSPAEAIDAAAEVVVWADVVLEQPPAAGAEGAVEHSQEAEAQESAARGAQYEGGFSFTQRSPSRTYLTMSSGAPLPECSSSMVRVSMSML